MTIHAATVLIVEDDPDTRANLSDILELDGYRIETASTIAETLKRTNWADIGTIIMDYKLPDGSAETLLPKLRELAPKAAVIVTTGVGGLNAAILAVRQGAADYILKPIDADALRTSLARIAERQKLGLDKERTEDAFRSLVEAAPCMILILRPDYSIVYFSRFAQEVTGYAANEVLGKSYFEVLSSDPESKAALVEKMHLILNGLAARGFESPVACKNRSSRWIVWNAQLLSDHEGAPAILAVGQDITSLKQAQEKALQSERLAAIGQMMAGLAHESGNALARSQACLEMLSFAVENQPKALNLITRIQSAQDHLKQLYDEVRNYAAPVKLQLENKDLPLVWRQAWQDLALLRQGKQASLEEDIEGTDLRLSLDPFRLEQVFRNIFENAIAACPEPIVVRIHCASTEIDGRPGVCVSCRDNGPGLNAEQRERIFAPFFTTKTKGTGLGMAIAKRIVEAHGGKIGVGTSVEPGAEIVLTLPTGKS
jgi:two-component system, LuxR family, sensor kinase FixL